MSIRARISTLLLFSFLLTFNAFAQDNLDEAIQRKLLPVMNQLRAKAGLPLLTSDDHRLADSAKLHVAEFVQHQTIADQYQGEPALAERLSIVKMPTGAAGEIMFNIHNSEAPAEDLFTSEKVREILLNPKFAKVGFAALPSGADTFVVIDMVQPLEMLSLVELEARLLDTLQKVRGRQKIVPFKNPEMKLLRGLSCEMAKKDSVKVKPINPYADYVGAPSSTFRSFTYTTIDPKEIPNGVETMAGDPKLNAVSVGTCFGKTPTYPGGTYWIALLFYSK